MSSGRRFSGKRFLRSFGYSWNGIKSFISTEQNGRIHLVISAIVIILGFVLNISTSEWIMVIICIGVVIAAEAMNTSIEKLCDHISPEKNENIGRVKDLASGAVLIVSVAAAVVGIIIFLPKLIAYQL